MSRHKMSEKVERTTFLDRFMCETFAEFALLEYLHNPEFKAAVNEADNAIVRFGDEKLPKADSFFFALGPAMVQFSNVYYPIALERTMTD